MFILQNVESVLTGVVIAMLVGNNKAAGAAAFIVICLCFALMFLFYSQLTIFEVASMLIPSISLSTIYYNALIG